MNYSPAFRELIRDVFSGSQDYRTMKRRLWAQLGITLTEFSRHFIDPAPFRRQPRALPPTAAAPLPGECCTNVRAARKAPAQEWKPPSKKSVLARMDALRVR